MTQPPKTAPSRRRRILWVVSALLALPVLAVLALPWALSTLPGRDWLLGQANRMLAPGMLRIDSLRFSWFGPTRMTWFVLTSAKGDRVVAAETATWDRNLFQILFERPTLGTFRLDRAALDIERAPDGTIDLYETLKPIIRHNPETSVRIEVVDGRLRFRGEGLAEPVEAEHAAISLAIVPRPGLVSCQVRLANGDVARPRNALAFDARLDRATTPGDLDVRVSGQHWPLALKNRQGHVSGRFAGNVSGARKAGRWFLSGDADLFPFAAAGPGFDSKAIGLDRVRGAWDVDLEARTGVLHSLKLRTTSGTHEASGNVAPGGKVQLDGMSHLVGLGWRWEADGTVGAGQVDGKVVVHRLTGDGEPIRLRVRASAPEGGGRIDLAELAVESEFVRLDAAGRIDDPAGKRVADLSGTVAPDWQKINAWLAKNVEPGANVSGRARAFRAHGALGDGGLDALEGEVGVNLDGADVYGMKVGPVAVVLHAKGGTFTVDPVDTTVNEGRLHLVPEIRTGGDSGPAAVVLGKGTTLTDAEVNDEVSRRVLSYVAPVLDRATKVRGRVSATIEKAVFPIDGKDNGPGPTVEGSVLFQDVAFIPGGELVDTLFAMVGREDRTGLRLDEPIALTIADRRVSQRGLTIPIGKLSKIEIEGWVGFDRTLNLTASVPVLPTMMADLPILNAVAGDARVKVPVRGTLRQPEIDREAFKAGMKDLARTLATRGGIMGAAGLLERLTRPRDPDAPPPPTAEERRERRQERREERQLRRGRVPD